MNQLTLEESITQPPPDLPEHCFYVDIPHDIPSEKEEFKGLLDEYFTHWIAGYENSKEKNVPHIHIVCKANLKVYNAFIARVKKRWKLSGRATKNERKQYGKIKKVRDIDNMISYTLKGKSFDYKGYADEYIDELAKASYIPEDTHIEKWNMLVKDIQYTAQKNGEFRKFETCQRLVHMYFSSFGTVITKKQADKIFYQAGLIDAASVARTVCSSYHDLYN